MSAVDEIHSAIDKLTKLRDESTSGPWFPWRSQSGHGNSSVDAATYDPDNPTTVCEGWRVQDIDLIVTLHATIDAQLEFLEAALKAVNETRGASSHSGPAFTLARAINGTT